MNATYFITAAGSRRTTTFMLDGASNDEGWGRQTMLATVPLGAIKEVSVLSNAFSAEFGWTSGPAMNIVTKSGTNALHGEGLYLARPGSWQAKTFSTDGFCPSSVSSCTTPSTLTAINPADVPDALNQVFRRRRRTARQGQDVLLRRRRSHPAGPDDVPVADAARVRAPADGSLEYVGHYRQSLVNARVDHKFSAGANADGAVQRRSHVRHESQ